jgi:hypothetical protein
MYHSPISFQQARPSTKCNPAGESLSTVYQFHCTQLEGEQTKNKKTEKVKDQHDRMFMDCFDCNGWLYITIAPNDYEKFHIRLTHHLPHTAYCNISVPEDVETMIKENMGLTASVVHRCWC